jgi:hypothetical protein
MFSLDPSGVLFLLRAKYENQSHLFILRLVSGEVRVWRNVPTPIRANRKGAYDYAKVVFLSYNQIEIFLFYYFFVILFEIRRCCSKSKAKHI